MNRRRILMRLLNSQTNVRFDDVVSVAIGLGFELHRQQGSHVMYIHRSHSLRLNLQDVRGQAKPYQVRQLLHLIEEYNLTLEAEEQV